MPDVPAKRKEESLEIECLVHRPAKRKEESLEIITPNSKLSTSFLTVARSRATQFKYLLLSCHTIQIFAFISWSRAGIV